MVIPCELIVLLERMFARKIGNELIAPPYEDRVDLYLRALKYVEKDLHLFSYVLGYRREVLPFGDCKAVDDILLGCICRDPRIIPKDFFGRLPESSAIFALMERLYRSRFAVAKFDYEECLEEFEQLALAAE